jgi:hypothetical protein
VQESTPKKIKILAIPPEIRFGAHILEKSCNTPLFGNAFAIMACLVPFFRFRALERMAPKRTV